MKLMETTEINPPDDTVTPPTPAEASASPDLNTELEALKAKAAENLDGWQRERANFVNYKRRVEREIAEANQNASANVMARFLPVLDDFELALKNMPDNDEAKKWAQGVALVQRKFTTLLENEGLKRIEATSKQFDPNFHEAVVHVEAAQPENEVIEVLRQGYILGDKVLRPALVKVSKGNA
jgi:molecular chaperone GrpE